MNVTLGNNHWACDGINNLRRDKLVDDKDKKTGISGLILIMAFKSREKEVF